MKKLTLFLIFLTISINILCLKTTEQFKPTVESLKNYKCPEWFRDAKFGIYAHWNAQTVAAAGGWYARNMYVEGHSDYEYHCEHYGHPSEFGYKDMIPLWKGEKFDPDWLVSLYKKAGAKYIVCMAVHHDNFDLWDSKHHKWNSVNMGPKKDIVGLLREATLKQGLRFGVTTHLARSYSWFNTNKGSDKKGPKKGIPYDGANPVCADFYFEKHSDTDRRHPINPPESWRNQWAARIKDLIDNYHPDHLYFDGAIPFRGDDQGRTGLEVIAHYYNANAKRHGGVNQGVMCIKKIENHGLYVDGVTTLDFERGKSTNIREEPWQTDTSIGPWFYNSNELYRPLPELIHEIVDIVSKNGNVLLNVPPKADGTLDEKAVSILDGIGLWMAMNGDAIYETRPWKIYGEWEGEFEKERSDLRYSRHAVRVHKKEIRYTGKGNVLYAISLNKPGSLLLLRSTAGWRKEDIKNVSLLGSKKPVKWEMTNQGLQIHPVNEKLFEYAFALKIECVNPVMELPALTIEETPLEKKY